MAEQRTLSTSPRLDEQEAALLAYAVYQLVQELGFPPEDVNRSFKDSFAYFMKTT